MGLFRRLFGSRNKEKKTSRSSIPTPSVSHKFHHAEPLYDASLDANRHAIAVAAATAAVAEAALAAAQAAAEVVRLTNAGAAPTPNVVGSRRRWQEELAVIRIQSAFRGYLARRALRALKALVKLQALVRGHIVRKQTSDMLRRMQTLVRVQARARACRTPMSDSWHSTSKASISQYARCGSNANFRDIIDRDKSKMGWLDHWMEDSLWKNHESSSLTNRHTDDDKSDKILEVDTWMPRVKSHQGNRSVQMSHVLASDRGNQNFLAFDSSSKLPKKMPNPMPKEEVLPLNRLKLSLGCDETVCRTADNSPHVHSASSRPGSNSRRSPFTPTKSEYSWGFFNGYSGYPSYMANTESSRAKVRSQSAPRQRLEIDKYGLTKRSFQGYGDTDTHSEMGFTPHTHLRNKAYKAPGYLNRLEGTGFR